ncbi:MAG: guanylate kinase [Firmicutes bacterium]|nr:guanylate kinase [Bacillota bacterium]MCL2256074.1 guanylate kinase [Bacillota bacterium]
MKENSGLLIIISGPSGAGKGTIYERVLTASPNMRRSVSVTTRDPRQGEKEGIHYFFKNKDEFKKMLKENAFLEHATVYTNYYGTPQKEVFENLEKGHDVIFDIDIEGARQIKSKYKDAIGIFVMPPSFEILRERLVNRKTETEESLLRRIGSAKSELAQHELFDYIVFNDTIERAVEDTMNIISAEKNKISFNKEKIKKLLN